MPDVRIFVDFWNFQLSWNENVKPDDAGTQFVRISWKDIPATLIGELPSVLGPSSDLRYRGTSVYASVNPTAGSKDEGLKRFLSNYVAKLTGFNAIVRERRPKRDDCPHCHTQIERMVEKGVDSAILTDLFQGAINDSYDIAILVSNDTDFIPAIQTIQERLNKQIIHAGFRRGSDHIRTATWAHINLDGDVVAKLRE